MPESIVLNIKIYRFQYYYGTCSKWTKITLKIEVTPNDPPNPYQPQLTVSQLINEILQLH